jgi:hypothetical protein
MEGGAVRVDEGRAVAQSSAFACALRACRERSTVNVPPLPALLPACGEMTDSFSGAELYESSDIELLLLWTAVPAAETGSQRPPNPVSPSPFVWPAFASWTK